MIKGYLEVADAGEVRGWAYDTALPRRRLRLDIIVDTVRVGQTVAQNDRPDLRKAGMGDGLYGFRFRYAEPLDRLVRHVVEVRTSDLLLPVGQGSMVIEPEDASRAVEQSLTDLLNQLGSDDEQAKKLDVLFEQIRLLLPKDGSEGRKSALWIVLRDRLAALWDLTTGGETAEKALDSSEGTVDSIDLRHVSGWAIGAAGGPVSLLISDNNTVLCRVLANRYRKDLDEAGLGNGRHAFEVDLPGGGLSPFERHVIRVRRESDGADLFGSPFVVEASNVLDETAKVYLTDLFGRATIRDDLVSTVDFLAGEAVSLLARMGDLESRTLDRRAYTTFLDRWRRRLPEAEAAIAAGEAPKPVLRALVIDERIPKSDRDAGSKAILSHIRCLQLLGYEVTFAAALEMRDKTADLSALTGMGVICCQTPYYISVEDVLASQPDAFDVVYLHRVHNAVKYTELARAYSRKAKLVYSVADLYHIRFERQAQSQDRPELMTLAQRMKRAEFLSAASADSVITHSTFEAAELTKYIAPAKIHVVPWTIAATPIKTPYAERSGLAFIGGYSHQPNLDAAHWLISEIMPQVRRHDPTIVCYLVGSDMPDELRKLCVDGVEAVGFVEDLSTILERVRLTIAPLAFGAGVKGKVLESLAFGLPCVCTPIAAEGIALPPELQAFVGGDVSALVHAIRRLHGDEVTNRKCAEIGLSFIEAGFSDAAITALLATAIGHKDAPWVARSAEAAAALT